MKTKTQQALNKAMSLAAEAISLANDYSGDESETAKHLQKQYKKLQREAEESYTQEVVSTSEDHNSILMEAAWFAMRHHYEDLAQYLDLSDEVLGPIVNKLDQQLNNE